MPLSLSCPGAALRISPSAAPSVLDLSRAPVGAVEFPANPAEPHLAKLRQLTHSGENAEAYFSADGRRLIFQATWPGFAQCDQIFTMDLDGRALHRVSTGSGRTTCGYFFPSGDRVLFSSTHHVSEACPAKPDFSRGYVWPLDDYEIYTARPDGSDLRRLTNSPGYDAEATVSSDGSTIVFTSVRGADLDIYAMSSDGSYVRRLTSEEGYDGGAFFSRDGRQIVYRAYHPADSAELADYRTLLRSGLVRPGKLDIWIMDANGSNKRQLTKSGGASFAPFFHPNGRQVIFSSNMVDPRSRNFDLYLINTDGTGLERVTVHPEFDGFPVFSPDGKQLVFASNRGAARQGDTNIFTAEWVDAPPATAARASSQTACPNPSALLAGLSPALAHVRYLADDALEGRLAGSAGERCAGDYIASEFRRLGLKPAGDSGTFFQAVPLASVMNPHAPSGSGRNVVAILEGSDAKLRAEAVVVGAHYDHLGWGGVGSLAPDERAVHNGADDNASGIAVLLEVAGALGRGPRPARSIVFVAFTGEESGLLGSAHQAAHPAVPLARVRAMLNLDMVGRLGSGPLIVNGRGTAKEWARMIADAAEAEGIRVVTGEDGYGPSDQTSFYTRDVPVLHFFTNTHADYHRPTDEWQRIDAAGLVRVASVVTRLARAAADERTTLTLVRGAGRPPTAAQGGGYGAYLGSIPDFSPVPHGVRITGVRAGSPGESAGMKAGDTIIRFDDEGIADIYALTKALRSRKAGDAVLVTVLREGRELPLRVVLGTRGAQ
ncbi:MAG: M28 family peptidase [Gemmatimonadaceae bacterium]